MVCEQADLLGSGRKRAKPGTLTNSHFEVLGRVIEA